MAERVTFDIEEIREFGRNIEAFVQDSGETVTKMNAALTAIRETWQDSQLDAPAQGILDANSRIMRIVGDLYPIVQDFLRRQETWYEDYISR